MCKLKSGIILKDRIFIPDHNSHSEMLEELGIKDDYLGASMAFVRAELSPKYGDAFTPVDEWEFQVDQDIVPDWFSEEEYKPRMIEAVKSWAAERIHVGKKGLEIYIGEGHMIKDCDVRYIGGSANVGWIVGSTRVDSIGGSVSVRYIGGSASVGSIGDSASVGSIGDSASVSINDPWDKLRDVEMSGYATIRDFFNKKIYQAGDFEIIRAKEKVDDQH